MKQALTKAQLAKEIAKRTDSTHKTAVTFLDALRDIAVREAKKKRAFRIPGIGRLTKSHRKARSGRIPMTGELIRFATSSRVRFSVDPATAAAFGVTEAKGQKKKSKRTIRGTSGTGPRIW